MAMSRNVRLGDDDRTKGTKRWGDKRGEENLSDSLLHVKYFFFLPVSLHSIAVMSLHVRLSAENSIPCFSW